MTPLDLGIVIVSWNVRDLLRRCLQSLEDSLRDSHIAYRIVVNRHGGTIRLSSEPGDTRFVVRLPSAPPVNSGGASGG